MSNKELAEKYFQVVSTTSFDISGVKSYERQKRRIEDSPIEEKDKKLKERIIFGSRPRKISRKDYFD